MLRAVWKKSRVIRLRRPQIAVILCLITGIMLTAMRVAAPAEEVRPPELPIIMYHHVLRQESRLGKFVVSPQELENDLIYLKEHGYETISLAQLLDFYDSGAPLPEHPVMLTFDDGHESFRTYAYPLLRQYGMCAVLSVVGAYAEDYSKSDDHNPSYAYATCEELTEMAASGRVELGNHTWALHDNTGGRKGCRIRRGEEGARYQAMLRGDLQAVQDRLAAYTGAAPAVFTYPFGAVCREAEEVIRQMGFRAAFTCEERRNPLRRGEDGWLFRLGRYNRPHGKSSADFFQKALGL